MSTLKTRQVSSVIDGSLLWPSSSHALLEPYWQNLEHLVVEFSTRRPSGGCYFRALQRGIIPPSEMEVPPGYGHSEEVDSIAAKYFSVGEHVNAGRLDYEVVPDDDRLVTLIEAFGQACLQMPRLKSAELSTRIPTPRKHDTGGLLSDRAPWGVWYLSPCTSPRWELNRMNLAFSENIHQRRLFWVVDNWCPNTELRCLLRNIGCERYGTHLVEEFVALRGL
jgi:hypothetical protein